MDSAVEYPETLVKNRVTGQVSIRLVVDQSGVFHGELLSVKGDQRTLEAYATAIILHALHSPLPESKWSKKSRNFVQFLFRFETYGYGSHPPENKPPFLANNLSFERWGYIEGKLNEKINRFFTNYFPPVIPFPGGFYIDLIRSYELIRNIGKEIPDPDASKARLLEMNLQNWKSTIKRNEN